MEDLESTHFNPFRVPSFVRKVVKEPQAQVESDESNPRWQPKITLYRLLVISTTISLGSAKAVAVFYGKSYVSITIEWIAGVAVSILLFMLGWLEDDPSQYPQLAWLVDCDVIRLTWGLFKKTPKYTSDERKPVPGPDDGYPPITGYRLLVSGNVFIFGMVKAYFAYTGLGGAANALDWTFGVIVTSALYILGLYESNPFNMMPYLFEIHYDNQVYSGAWFISKLALHLGGLTCSLALSWLFNRVLRKMRNGVQVSFLEVYDGTKEVGPPTFFGEVHDMSMRYMMDGVVWWCILTGIGFSLYFLWEIVSAFGELMVFRKLLHLLRRAFLWASKIISHQFSEFDFSIPTRAAGAADVITKFYRFMRRFGVHISVFTVAAIICAVPTVFFLGFPFRIFHRTETRSEFIVVMVIGILYIFITGLMGGVFCVGLALSIREVLRPFYQNLEDPHRQRTLLEI